MKYLSPRFLGLYFFNNVLFSKGKAYKNRVEKVSLNWLTEITEEHYYLNNRD